MLRETPAASSYLRYCRAAPHRPAAGLRASPPKPALAEAGGDDDLHTIRPVIARVPEAALVAFRKRRIRLEISARQIVEQHVVADVEQVSPPPRQVIKDRLLMHQQPVVTAVQLLDLGQPCVLTQQIGQGTALKPLTVQPPLAARRQQTVDDQREQDLIPARPFAAHSQPL